MGVRQTATTWKFSGHTHQRRVCRREAARLHRLERRLVSVFQQEGTAVHKQLGANLCHKWGKGVSYASVREEREQMLRRRRLERRLVSVIQQEGAAIDQQLRTNLFFKSVR